MNGMNHARRTDTTPQQALILDERKRRLRARKTATIQDPGRRVGREIIAARDVGKDGVLREVRIVCYGLLCRQEPQVICRAVLERVALAVVPVLEDHA